MSAGWALNSRISLDSSLEAQYTMERNNLSWPPIQNREKLPFAAHKVVRSRCYESGPELVRLELLI